MNTLHLIDTATLTDMLEATTSEYIKTTPAYNKMMSDRMQKKKLILELQKLIELRKLTPTAITS